MKVPWLSKKKIARYATSLITKYQAVVQHPIAPPIPVENIIERVLDLTLDYKDLREQLGFDDVLGATFVNQRKITVDNSLVNDKFEGRLCFTFAHETGHWVLHRDLIDQACTTGDDSTISPNTQLPSAGSFIFCRKKDAKKPIEWQADYFASCLLMPEEAVRSAFYEIYGPKPLILYNVKSAFCGPICFDPCVENWPKIADKVKQTGGFSNVSKQAMIIRLQDLGLVKNETHARLCWDQSFAIA